MRGRVGCFMTPITGSSGGSESCSFWQNMGLGFGPSGTISVQVVHGWQNLWGHWGQDGATLCVCIVWSQHCRMWPSLSCKVACQSCSHFSQVWKLNKSAPWCSKALIWIFIKLQLCVFYLSLIHLASWDITVLHSNYCGNICILILWGRVSLRRI